MERLAGLTGIRLIVDTPGKRPCHCGSMLTQGEKVKLPRAPLELVELTVTTISKGPIRGPNFIGDGVTVNPMVVQNKLL